MSSYRKRNLQTSKTITSHSSVDDDVDPPTISQSSVPLVETVPLRRSQSFPNLSINFAGSPSFWMYYIVLLLIGRFVLFLFPILAFWPPMTVLNIVHGIVTLYCMHWKRGTADPFDAGRNDRFTFWELLDGGKLHTPTRKFFILIPIALYIIACYEHHWRKRYVVCNLVAVVISILPKMPFMMGVRFFGWNNKSI